MGNEASKSGKKSKSKAAEEDPRKVIFQKYDANKSGTLCSAEIQQGLSDLSGNFEISPTKEEIDHIINSIDKNSDNELNFAEFCTLYDQIKESGDSIRQQFEFFDKDGSGSISRKELKQALKELNEKISKTDLKRMLKESDLDGDGVVFGPRVPHRHRTWFQR